MTRFVQAFLAGIFFTFILDFFLFLGIFLHYIGRYEIDVFYNILFADHQNLWYYLLCSALLGWLTIYYGRPRPVAAVLAALFGLVLLSLLPPVGEKLGAMMLMEKAQHLVVGKSVYKGDVYYRGREFVYIYDEMLAQMVKLPKSEIKE